jgi:heptosyltransferase I
MPSTIPTSAIPLRQNETARPPHVRGRMPDMSSVKEVLIVKPSSLGDIVHALPAVKALHNRWPDLKLRWLVNEVWAPLLKDQTWLTEIITFPRAQFKGLGGLMKVRPWLQAQWVKENRPRPDLVLDLQGLFRSGLISRSTQAPHRIGMSDSREFARFSHTAQIRVDSQAHAIDRYFTAVEALGVNSRSALNEDLLPRGEHPGVGIPGHIVVINPFSRGANKSLSWSDVAQLCDRLKGWPIAIVGITSDPPPDLPLSAINITNRTNLDQLVWIIRRAALVISVDSAPMHIASALQRPVLGIHSWSDPRRVGPYDENAYIWKGGLILQRPQVTNDIARQRQLPHEHDLDFIAEHARRMLGG